MTRISTKQKKALEENKKELVLSREVKKDFSPIESDSPIKESELRKKILKNVQDQHERRYMFSVFEFYDRDTLTKAYNRRAFESMYKIAFERAIRLEGEFSIAIFDIDFFKKVNDTYGHAAGDKVLQEFVAIIKNVTRGNEPFCRVGGEEFVLILDADEEGCAKACERIRKVIEKELSNYSLDKKNKISITASIGCATFPIHAKYGKELLEMADKALYKAKHDGRNRVESASNVLFTFSKNKNK